VSPKNSTLQGAGHKKKKLQVEKENTPTLQGIQAYLFDIFFTALTDFFIQLLQAILNLNCWYYIEWIRLKIIFFILKQFQLSILNQTTEIDYSSRKSVSTFHVTIYIRNLKQKYSTRG
jgi:hypothetical protein